ncbi:MAG TPA: ACP S-malonyltransferase [Pseudomonadales bacterium]|nr:ACP S-malonyltransferase [Pseudomonadales bacterium]
MSTTLGMMFPGQGSQSLGMLADLAAVHEVIGQTFAEASDALGEDLWSLAQTGPQERLDQTEHTQPVLLTASVAVFRAWIAAGGATPTVAAGHSLGEYSALVAAGVMSLADGVRLVRERGRAMQAAVPAGQGGMAAILGLDDADVERCCASAAGAGVVSAANYNAPGQVVIAGDAQAIERAVAACKEAGAKRAMPLTVSVPSHCALMAPATELLAERLAAIELATPAFPILHNVDAAVADDAQGIRARLLDQLHAPVRWADCVRAMRARGVDQALECGPGKVLTGLVKRIDRDLAAAALGDVDGFAAALAQA